MFQFLINLFSRKKNSVMEISKNAFLVDVRSQEEFEEGHVHGSTNIPLGLIQEKIDQFKDKEQVVVFCRSGMRSGQAKSILEKNGITNVINGGTWNQINMLRKAENI